MCGTTSAHLAGNSPSNVSCARESPNSSHSNMSPLAYSTPALPLSAATYNRNGQSQQYKEAGDNGEPSQKKSMAILSVHKELIEKMDPKLPTIAIRTEDNQEKFLVIEWEELVTLPNLLGGVSDIDVCGGLFCYVIFLYRTCMCV